jgi:hypothetical protein
VTTYVMAPKEDLTAAQYALLAGGGALAPPSAYIGNQKAGEYYDAARRQFVNPFHQFGDAPTNETGFTLYMGQASENIAPDAAVDEEQARNLYTSVKSIDDGSVTLYNAYAAANQVPSGIGGGDGSWRRYAATQYLNCCPNTIDPWTGNIWLHGEAIGDFACTIYCLRAEDDYSQIISPMLEIAGFTHYEPMFSTEDWIGVLAVNGATDDLAFALTPREFTAEETSQDFILSYCDFEMPWNNGARHWRYVAVPGDYVYVFSKAITGAPDFTLHKFEFPSSAPWGGPIVGGGFTDETPWAAGTGPNTDCASYIYDHNDTSHNTLLLYHLPATNVLVCVSKLWPENTDNSIPYTLDPLLVRFDCTYVDLDDMSFDYHEGFVTGYMTAAWAPTTDPNAAAWSVIECQELNLYLGNTTYQFDGFDYTKRWLWFRVQPVVAGTWTPEHPIRQFGADDATTRIVMVEYQFAKGSAPQVLRVVDDAGWNETYAAYGTEVGDANVVRYSLDDRYWHFGTLSLYNNGVYDPETAAFWWGVEQTAIGYLGPNKFLDQLNYADTNAPWLRLAFSESGAVHRVVTTNVRIGLPSLTPLAG